MTYEGVTLDCGLKVKNSKIVTEAKIDYDAIKHHKINSGPIPQTIAKRKAREAALDSGALMHQLLLSDIDGRVGQRTLIRSKSKTFLYQMGRTCDIGSSYASIHITTVPAQ